MYLHKEQYKIQNTKTYLNAITTDLAMPYLHSNKTNTATFSTREFLKKLNEITFLSASMPVSLSTGIDLDPIPLNIYSLQTS